MATIVSTRISRLQSVSPRSTSGIDQSGVVVSLSNSAVSLPADALGTVTSYAGATTTISVTHGGVDQSSLWTFTKSDGSGVTSSLSGQTLTVSSLVVDIGQVTITASRTGYTSQSRTFSLSRAKSGSNGTSGASGTNGQRGSVTLYASGSAWSDATANSAIVTATGSSTKIIGDTVTISNGSSFAKTRYWSGTAWVDTGVVIDGNLLVLGSVSASVLSGGQISGVTIDIGSGAFRVNSSGIVTASGVVISVATFGNLWNPYSPCITATTTAGSSAPAIKATCNPGANAIEAYGPAYVSGNLTVGGTVFGTVSYATSAGSATTATSATSCTDAACVRNSSNAVLYCNSYRAAMQADGNFVAYGVSTWSAGTNASDGRVKENIRPTTKNGLDTIKALSVVDFTWKQASSLYDGGKLQTGFIAQAVSDIVPGAVHSVELPDDLAEKLGINDMLFLHKEDLVPYLVKAVQELAARVATLEAQ